MDDVIKFITLIRETANNEMVRIFTCGGCYRFYLILKKVFPNAEPYMIIDPNDNSIKHIVTKIEDKFYDVNGEYKNLNELKPMDVEHIQFAENFRYPVIQESEIEINNIIIRKRKKILNIWRILIFFLFVTAIGEVQYVYFFEAINIILNLFCIGVLTRLIIATYFKINSKYCPSCGRYLK